MHELYFSLIKEILHAVYFPSAVCVHALVFLCLCFCFCALHLLRAQMHVVIVGIIILENSSMDLRNVLEM